MTAGVLAAANKWSKSSCALCIYLRRRLIHNNFAALVFNNSIYLQKLISNHVWIFQKLFWHVLVMHSQRKRKNRNTFPGSVQASEIDEFVHIFVMARPQK
jgi:hypothetical protein